MGDEAVGLLAAVSASIPSNPVRQFQLLYCAWIVTSMLLHMRRYERFYRWFYSSGIGLASKRGLGAHPSKIYGIFTPPTLTPLQLRWTGWAFTGCLVGACTPLAPRVFLFVAFLLYFFYFTQLYADATLSGHNSILIPAMLLLLSCSPSLDHEVQSSSVWPLQLIRIYLSSGYFSSGMAKLLCSFRFGRFWGRGSTLQQYILEAMFSRPSQLKLTRAVQWNLLKRPWLLAPLATGALAFELSFVAAPFIGRVAPIYCVGGIALHSGILWLQGLDFVSLWSASLLAFAFPLGAPWDELLRLGLQHELAWFLPAASYTALQILAAVTLYDLWLDDILPFSCCPMFMPPRSPFDKLPKWQMMTTAPLNESVRRAGAMEPLYWSPVSGVFELTLEDIRKLPQKVVWFGSTCGMPPEALKFVKEEYRSKPFLMVSGPSAPHRSMAEGNSLPLSPTLFPLNFTPISFTHGGAHSHATCPLNPHPTRTRPTLPALQFSNFELSAELKTLLHQWVDWIHTGTPVAAHKYDTMQQTLRLQQDCLDAFRACVSAPPSETEAASSSSAIKRE
jgi:hypothetical protein